MFQMKMEWKPEDLMLGVIVVRQLALLRQSFEEIGGQPSDPMPFTLLLADVCDALCFPEDERRLILGPQGLSFLTEWGDTPVGLVEENGSALADN